jgi:DNA end-binding protein Ku
VQKRVEARIAAGPERLTPRQVEKARTDSLPGGGRKTSFAQTRPVEKKRVVARPIWSGTISFGLVSVPVRMYTATSSQELRFHFLDRRDMAPIGYDKVNKDTGDSVPADEIIRGFEVDKGRFVEVTEEDIDRLDVELTHSIDICDFVSIEEIDPLYFRKGYYLLPSEGAEKPYRLLVKALEETGRVAIAKVVIRNKQHLSCLRPVEDALVLETMYYADEVRQPEEAPKPQVRAAEVEMAKTLIENLAAKWDPERYHDQYRNELLDLLQKKVEGEPLPEPAAESEGEVVDLMEALRQSVEATKKQKKRTAPAKRKAS